MKKILVSALAALMLVSLCSCTPRSGKYKVLDLPNELTIEAKALSEDENNLLNMDEDYPLLAAKPDDGLYVYVVNPQTMQGVVVKYNGFLQYFPWDLIPQLAEPSLYVADYNEDGEKDVAITYVDATASAEYREVLHVLLCTKKGMEDCVYSGDKVSNDADNHVVVEKASGKNYNVYVDGIAQKFVLEGNYGDLQGVYWDNVQDFTLGDTIKVDINPGFVFSNAREPVYNVFSYSAEVTVGNGTGVQVKPEIKF